MHPDEIIASIAERQHGAIATKQLHANGLTGRQIRHRIERGQLERRPGAVVLVRGGPPTFEREVMAACLGLGTDAAASHRAGARLLGLELRLDVPVEVSVPRNRTPRIPGAIVHRATDLVPDHVTTVGPIPTTNPYRLLLDLGSVVPWWTLSRALEDLIAARRVKPQHLRELLDTIARRGRNGVGVLRKVLDDRALGNLLSDSGLEEELAKVYREYEVEAPVFQHSILLDGRWRYIDFSYPELEIAIEVDGYEVHIREATFEDDRLRGNDLELLGWTILHFTRNMILHRRGYVARTTTEALRIARTRE